MRRYYFDLRDDNGLFVDDEGLECRDVSAVQAEAARALADMARDVEPTHRLMSDRSPRRQWTRLAGKFDF